MPKNLEMQNGESLGVDDDLLCWCMNSPPIHTVVYLEIRSKMFYIFKNRFFTRLTFSKIEFHKNENFKSSLKMNF